MFLNASFSELRCSHANASFIAWLKYDIMKDHNYKDVSAPIFWYISINNLKYCAHSALMVSESRSVHINTKMWECGVL
jgi:hypothetical protein